MSSAESGQKARALPATSYLQVFWVLPSHEPSFAPNCDSPSPCRLRSSAGRTGALMKLFRPRILPSSVVHRSLCQPRKSSSCRAGTRHSCSRYRKIANSIGFVGVHDQSATPRVDVVSRYRMTTDPFQGSSSAELPRPGSAIRPIPAPTALSASRLFRCLVKSEEAMICSVAKWHQLEK